MTDPFDFEDLGPPAHDAHVQLFHGFDLTSHDPLFRPDMAPCPFCDAMTPGDAPDELLLTEEWRHDRYVHFIICGACGACGPTQRSESRAVQAWNVVGGGWMPPPWHARFSTRSAT